MRILIVAVPVGCLTAWLLLHCYPLTAARAGEIRRE